MYYKILQKMFWGNSVQAYLVATILFFASLIAIKLFQRFILERLHRWAEKTKTTIDDFLVEITQKMLLPLAVFGAFYLSINSLNLDPLFKKIIDIAGMAVLTVLITYLITVFITYVFTRYWKKRGKDILLERGLNGMLRVLRVVIWGLAIVFFLDNLGIKISSVIAGLGIGGVAVALAAQAILGDLFSYFAILFDRPFEIGDFIIIEDYLGTIEHIGIKTTRLRSLGGEQLVFSNTDLTGSRVRNYKRMQKRRVVFKLGVTYQTPVAKLKEIPKVIKNIIENVKDTAFDRAHFFSYGDFNLIVEVVYYVLSPDYNKYMDTQQEINFAIKEEFERRGIDFAFPTQTVYVAKTK